ncbi:MAG: M1 family metallopeptidase [Enterobacterales bacterium]|nr:M1 family metallopeptidase [Enterobacterales bacterium]
MKLFTHLLLALCIVGLSSNTFAFERDWHTQSNYQQVVTNHITLDLQVDFDKKQLIGNIVHHISFPNGYVKQLVLDTRDLDIHKVSLFTGKKWQSTRFVLGQKDAVRGSRLSIELVKNTSQVKISYNSRPQASGLQWLSPQQTAGKKLPFMFSQSQAIHARSWMPIQDTPAMRVTYSADIKTPSNLRPIMSAKNDPVWNNNGQYHFEMPQAIPTYLIAIAAGNIQHKAMSKQTAVYAEPEILDAAAKEFEDTQTMIDATEKLYGPYRWGEYDLLILPPSFPFGGMENPRLSFITPTVIAGDKSLVSLIAHELAHSWSGNLVTNATWRDLWLNEGFTSYVENRIMESVYGSKRAIMEQVLGVQDLKHNLTELPAADTILHIKIQGRDPDDAFSDVPYVKGQLFLMRLEECFGRKDFDQFLRNYFENYAFKSIDTAGFKAYISANLLNKYPGKITQIEVNQWLESPGLPKTAPQPHSDVFVKVQQQRDLWLAGKIKLNTIPTNHWTVHEWLFFINNLPPTITKKQLAQLDLAFDLTQTTNNEIAHAWLLLSIEKGYNKVNTRLTDYMVSIGRRKLIVPLYKALIKTSEGRQLAHSIYKKARPGYHPLAQGTIDALFKK